MSGDELVRMSTTGLTNLRLYVVHPFLALTHNHWILMIFQAVYWALQVSKESSGTLPDAVFSLSPAISALL